MLKAQEYKFIPIPMYGLHRHAQIIVLNFVNLLFVLLGWSLLSNALRHFKIDCAHPNLCIGTWICRLNFAQRPIFQAGGSLTSLKSQTRDPQLKVPPGGLVLKVFTFRKNPSTSARFEPTNFGSGAHYPETTEADTTIFTHKQTLWCQNEIESYLLIFKISILK